LTSFTVSAGGGGEKTLSSSPCHGPVSKPEGAGKRSLERTGGERNGVFKEKVPARRKKLRDGAAERKKGETFGGKIKLPPGGLQK